jgi:hypothetical protein
MDSRQQKVGIRGVLIHQDSSVVYEVIIQTAGQLNIAVSVFNEKDTA